MRLSSRRRSALCFTTYPAWILSGCSCRICVAFLPPNPSSNRWKMDLTDFLLCGCAPLAVVAALVPVPCLSGCWAKSRWRRLLILGVFLIVILPMLGEKTLRALKRLECAFACALGLIGLAMARWSGLEGGPYNVSRLENGSSMSENWLPFGLLDEKKKAILRTEESSEKNAKDEKGSCEQHAFPNWSQSSNRHDSVICFSELSQSPPIL